MRAIIMIASKDLRLMMRDRMVAFFTLAFPLAVAFFFGVIFGGGGGDNQPMKVAVFNAHDGTASNAFVKAMEADGAFEVTRAPTRAAGETMVRGDKAVALVVLPEDFDTRATTMMSGNGPTVELIVDPSHKAEGGLLTGKLAQISFQTMFQRFTDPVQMESMVKQVEQGVAAAGFPDDIQKAFRTSLSQLPELNKRLEAAEAEKAVDKSGDKASDNPMKDWMPVHIQSSTLQIERQAPTNAFAISFLQGITWGLFGVVLAFTGSMADERERGTLLRLLAAPIRPIQVLAGKAVACFVTCAFVEVLLVAVGVFICGVRVSSVPLFAVATLATAFAFTGIMMMLAAIFRTTGGAQGAGRAALLVLTMIGGGTVPLFVMPPAMQMASSISPFKWAVTVAEGATWRAWDLQMMAPSLAVLLVIGVITIGVSIAAMKRRLA